MADQITINVTDTIPPINQATIDLQGKTGNTYSKTQLEDRLEDIESGNNLGFIDTETPPPPNTGIYRGQASEAGTYVNFGGTVVTQAELDANLVFIEVKNGVITKIPILKPVVNGKISEWVAQSYTYSIGDAKQVFKNGKIWENNANTLSTDIPGISPKWVLKTSETNVFFKDSFQITNTYKSVLDSVLDIKIWSNDSNSYFQITSQTITGYLGISKRLITDNSILATVTADIVSLRLIKGTIYECYLYNATENFWVYYKIDKSKAVAFSATEDTKATIQNRFVAPLIDNLFMPNISGAPLIYHLYNSKALKDIKVYTDLNLNLTLRNNRTDRVILYDINNANKPYEILKSKLTKNESGFYSGFISFDNNVIIYSIIDFDSITSNYSTTNDSGLYVSKSNFDFFKNAFLKIATKGVFVPQFLNLDSFQNGTLKAINYIKIHTNDYSKKYTVQGLKKTGTVILIWERDLSGVATTTPYFEIKDSDKVFISANVWYVDQFYNGIRFQIQVDDSLITNEFTLGGTTEAFIDSKNYIATPNGVIKRMYANMGASTSSGSWNYGAARKLNFDYTMFSVGGCTYRSAVGAVKSTTVPSAASPNNCFMNQISRLKASGINPDVISVMCGTTDASGFEGVIGTFNDGISANFDGLTEDNWLSDAPLAYRQNTAITIAASIKFLAKIYPYAQLIMVTVQQTASLGYSKSNVLLVNNLIKDLSKYYSQTVIDFGGESGIDEITASTFISSDLIHFSPEGSILASNFMYNQLKNKISLRKKEY